MHHLWECKMVQPHWKTVWHFLIKLNRQSPSYPANGLLSTYPRKMKTYVQTKTYTRTCSNFICNSQREISLDVLQQVNGNKLVHPNYEYLSAIERNELLLPITT